MNITPGVLIIGIIILLVIGIAIGMSYGRQRTKRLQEHFGPEYDRTVSQVGNPMKAERELEGRLGHVKKLDIRPLSPEETERFSHDWKMTQAAFVDQPLSAIQKANKLIKSAMSAKGYPVDDFEQRAADISVDYPDLVEDYRGFHALAVKGDREDLTTEELRQAMIHGRALFEDLVQPAPNGGDTRQKERL
jgi:hypothetical protein